jgi:hypothetical protein
MYFTVGAPTESLPNRDWVDADKGGRCMPHSICIMYAVYEGWHACASVDHLGAGNNSPVNINFLFELLDC